MPGADLGFRSLFRILDREVGKGDDDLRVLFEIARFPKNLRGTTVA
jgi:hypothetical protein